MRIVGYADSDHGGCIDTLKCTSGMVLFVNGCAIRWRTERQTSISESTAAAELLALFAWALDAERPRLLLQESLALPLTSVLLN